MNIIPGLASITLNLSALFKLTQNISCALDNLQQIQYQVQFIHSSFEVAEPLLY